MNVSLAPQGSQDIVIFRHNLLNIHYYINQKALYGLNLVMFDLSCHVKIEIQSKTTYGESL